jgi:hypothetical protein
MAISDRLQRRTVLLLAAASLACAPAGPEGEPVHIAEESAIIIWDAATKTQHFVRRASFETKAKDFGFLVPTPSIPTLAEADDEVFRLLERVTQVDMMRAVAKSDTKKSAEKKEAPVVVVIKRVKVAGFDAAVLAANDANALDAWLKGNQYASTPELVEWYKPYIDKRWIITAFKIAGGESSTHLDASAVRMTFRTEQPFFPYREPAAPKSDDRRERLLRIFYLGDARPDGKIGADEKWPGRASWSGPIDQTNADRLYQILKLPAPSAANPQRLTVFTDYSSPRPGRDDLYFATSGDQSLIPDPKVIAEFKAMFERQKRKREIEEWIGIGATLLVVAAIAYFILRRRRSGK